jgi:hypothetical protein
MLCLLDSSQHFSKTVSFYYTPAAPEKTPNIIISFKIKNPAPVELCWRKKEIPRISLIFLGWPHLPPKFDVELLSLLT